jgi:hypothetical protein
MKFNAVVHPFRIAAVAGGMVSPFSAVESKERMRSSPSIEEQFAQRGAKLDIHLEVFATARLQVDMKLQGNIETIARISVTNAMV